MLKKLGMLALVPLTITSCWAPDYDEEFFEVSDGIYKEYGIEIEHMLNTIDDDSLVNLLVTGRGVSEIANHAFESDFGIEHYIHGTGFIIHQDTDNYYVATNYHVIADYLDQPATRQIIISKANGLDNLTGSHPGNNNDPGGYVYDVDSDRAIVYGDQIMYDGIDVEWGFPFNQGHTGEANPKNRKIDFAVISVPKDSGSDGFEDGYKEVPLADPIIFDYEIGESWIFNKSWEGYTVGFPAGYKRINKGGTFEIQIITGNSIQDAKNGSWGIVSEKTYWQQNWYYEFFQAGGSSGSPIVNEDGELITLLASGYNYNGTEYTGGVSLNEVNAAICNAPELTVLRSIGHCTT